MRSLELENVEKAFGASFAVQRFDLAVERGEFISFLGPSGCGKTTTLRMVAGFELPTTGQIRIDGRDVTNLRPNQRNIGMVFQSYALFPNMTVADNVAFGLKVAKRAPHEVDSRVAEMLKVIKLPQHATRYPYQLSGGQQQRVALARALAIKPKLLLLDEPLSALDAKIRVSLREEIRSLQRSLGITTIYVTHDQEEALSMADRVVVMNAGRIEQAGTPQEIYRQPASAFVADFVGKVNVISAIAEGVGHFRVGALVLDCGAEQQRVESGTKVKLYLRPEDVVIDGAAEGNVNATRGEVQKVEFLGAFCMLTMKLADAPEQPLVVNVSRHSLDEMRIAEGTSLRVGLPPDCLRLLN